MLKLVIAFIAVGYIYVKLFEPHKRYKFSISKTIGLLSSIKGARDPIEFEKGIPDSRKEECLKEDCILHKKHSHLSTLNERRFHSILLEVIPSNYIIHSQVSLIALVTPLHPQHSSKTWAKRMDFVITNKKTKVFAVIELDDSSSLREKRMKCDQYIETVLNGHHPFLRFENKVNFKKSEIIEKIEENTQIRCRHFSPETV